MIQQTQPPQFVCDFTNLCCDLTFSVNEKSCELQFPIGLKDWQPTCRPIIDLTCLGLPACPNCVRKK